MNSVTLVLRCFECDWGLTVRDWATALEEGIAHEREHGKGVPPGAHRTAEVPA